MQTGHMCQPTSCHDSLHLEKTYLTHSFINFNDFCCIQCAKWRAIKGFWAPKETEQCTKIHKSLSLRYQHVYLSSCNCDVTKMFVPYSLSHVSSLKII